MNDRPKRVAIEIPIRTVVLVAAAAAIAAALVSIKEVLLLVFVGVFHAFAGLAAILKNEFFVTGANYAYEVDVTLGPRGLHG